MILYHSYLLRDTVQLAAHNNVLVLNSANDPFVQRAQLAINTGTITLAEDNITATDAALARKVGQRITSTAFHDYISHYPAGTMDIALMNLLYQPGNAWVLHGLSTAAYALRVGGYLYVAGAKDRGILSTAKRMQAYFGNVETVSISKGWRVVRSQKQQSLPVQEQDIAVFAHSKLDDGTRLLLEALEVHSTDEALDIGSGAGFIGLHIAHLATQGHVTMVDASLAALAVVQKAVAQNGLTNVTILPSDGAQAVIKKRFDLVVTNPPFHQAGIQTMETAERFIRESAQILRPQGRFYIVANRFLKYEPTLRASFTHIEEVAGDTRYKVLRALLL